MDSIKYSSSNWFKVVLLGLVVFMADISNEVTIHVGTLDLSYIIIGAGLILGIYQIGFLFRVIEETTRDFDEMPKFDEFISTFLHGIKETLITVIYFIIPFILVIIGAAIVDDFIGLTFPEIDFAIIIFGLFLASLIYIIYQATVLNMADHHGTIKSAFDFKRIFRKTRDIGFRKLCFIYLLTVVLALTVDTTVHDAVVGNPFDLWSIISALVIAPFILIFIARTLGLINRSLEMEKN